MHWEPLSSWKPAEKFFLNSLLLVGWSCLLCKYYCLLIYSSWPQKSKRLHSTLKAFHSYANMQSLMYGLTPLPILLEQSDSRFIVSLLICDSAEQIWPQTAACHRFPLRIDFFYKEGRLWFVLNILCWLYIQLLNKTQRDCLLACGICNGNKIAKILSSLFCVERWCKCFKTIIFIYFYFFQMLSAIFPPVVLSSTVNVNHIKTFKTIKIVKM